MTDDQQIRDKLAKIKALFAGATTPGERQAAQSALNRVQQRIDGSPQPQAVVDPPVEFRFSLTNRWSLRLFLALARSKGGDSLWAFTRNRQNLYVLAAELVVRSKTVNPPGFRYGHYRLWGDLVLSRYFLTEGQPRIDQVVRHLSVTANAPVLGSSFQGVMP